MSSLIEVNPEYIYITIPAEYICVYHRLIAMLADFGEEMLKDCKASCTDKNKGVIECYNMFNAAVAAKKLGKDKLAETLIKYIKAKINQIYKGADNSTSFVFPVDENGELKAVVSCGERPRFEINPEDGLLYEHKFNNGFDEHFRLGPEDESADEQTPDKEEGLSVKIIPRWETIAGSVRACADLYVWYDGEVIDPNDCSIDYYFDQVRVHSYNEVTNITIADHIFMVVVKYNDKVEIAFSTLHYGN